MNDGSEIGYDFEYYRDEGERDGFYDYEEVEKLRGLGFYASSHLIAYEGLRKREFSFNLDELELFLEMGFDICDHREAFIGRKHFDNQEIKKGLNIGLKVEDGGLAFYYKNIKNIEVNKINNVEKVRNRFKKGEETLIIFINSRFELYLDYDEYGVDKDIYVLRKISDFIEYKKIINNVKLSFGKDRKNNNFYGTHEKLTERILTNSNDGFRLGIESKILELEKEIIEIPYGY